MGRWGIEFAVVVAGVGKVQAAWPVTQITANSYGEQYYHISGSNVVWYGKPPDGSDYEIFLYDRSGIRQITDNSYVDIHPQVSGSTVVCQGVSQGVKL